MLFHVTFWMRKTTHTPALADHVLILFLVLISDDKINANTAFNTLQSVWFCCNDEACIDAVIDGSIQQTRLCIIALALVSTRHSDSNEHTHSTQMTCSLISRSTSTSPSFSISTSTSTATANDSMEVFHFLQTFAILLFCCVLCAVWCCAFNMMRLSIVNTTHNIAKCCAVRLVCQT